MVTSVNKVLISRALVLGFCDDSDTCLDKINEAARLSAPFTHAHGNRRNLEWVFKVVDGAVVDIGLIKCDYCLDSRKVWVFSECPRCDGAGCQVCRGHGGRKIQMACQDCK